LGDEVFEKVEGEVDRIMGAVGCKVSEAIETDRECGLVLGLEDEGVMADVESETDETGRKEEGGRA
jgi:hypothetical protein